MKIDFDRYNKYKVNFFDINRNLLPITEGNYSNHEGEYELSEHYDEIMRIAKDYVKVPIL